MSLLKFFPPRLLKLRQRIQAADLVLPWQRGEITHHLSIVVPTYNVARYIGRFLQSLDDQTTGLRNVEIIIVDDGSTDGSGEIARAWCDLHKGAQYIYQENQGLSAARNRGMREATGEWISFPDPDDYLSRHYLHIVDRELSKPANRQLSVLSCRPVVVDDATGRISNSHPARYRFAHKNRRRVRIKDLGHDLQFQVCSAWVRRQLIEKHQLRFDPRIRPTFEDAHLLYRLFLRELQSEILFCGPAVYFYRKRGDSLVGSARSKPEWYTAQLRYGYLALLDEARALLGRVPAFLQQAILYDLKPRFTHVVAHPEATAILGPEQQEDFQSLLAEIMCHIDAEIIAEAKVQGFRHEDRVAILARYKGGERALPHLYIRHLDWQRRQVQFAYFSTRPGDLSFKLNGAEVDATPIHPSSATKTFLGEPYVTEHRFWMDIPDGAAVTATLDALPVSFAGRGYRSSGEFTWAAATRRSPRLRLLAFMVLPRYRACWLFMDREDKADDNAEHLYRHVMASRRKAYYVLDRQSSDWERLRKDGFRLIPYRSARHYLAHLGSRLLLSSHVDHHILSPFRTRWADNPTRDFIFLQHGVTKDDLSRWLNSKPIRLMVTATAAEHRSISAPSSNYLLSEKTLILSGLPRHDALLRYAASRPTVLLVMPTWRRYLTDESKRDGMQRGAIDSFNSTAYARNWNALLRADGLRDLAAKAQLRVVFCAHPNMSMYLDGWNLPPWVEPTSTLRQPSIQSLLGETALLVTDYSSIAFDAAYLGRLVVYFQFDQVEFQRGEHVYDPGYFDYHMHGFGPVTETSEQAIGAIASALAGQEPMEYAARRRDTFAFRDGRCCERVYDAARDIAGEACVKPGRRKQRACRPSAAGTPPGAFL